MSAPSSGLLRVPFVRRCSLRLDDGRRGSFFLVNINVMGAYVARDDLTASGDGQNAVMPHPGDRVVLQFAVPGREGEIEIGCLVSWQNTRQQHPVHSLPPGIGVRFVDLTAETGRVIEHLVRDYVARRTR
ncbi:MAG TPA: PilZ domain-containing protein [Vicinamibacteria bacterium]|nr:PilZ domain-containing protein [Vicinamibacteria bacterium]